MYKCECGKEFEKPNSFNAHKSHCLIHLGPEKYNDRNHKQMVNMGKLGGKVLKDRKELKLLTWISEKHTCEKCGKIMIEKFGSGRFCSRYCANSRCKTHETKEKISESMLKTLSKNISLNFSLWKPTKHGFYNGFRCDSSWELAWVIYNIEHNIKFSRNTEGFDYIYKESHHLYFPDFVLEDGTYIEIKGRESTKDNYKWNSFPKHKKLIILKEFEMQKYLDYVINKYGKDFCRLYE